MRSDVDGAQSTFTKRKAQAEKHYRKRQRGALNQPRRQGGDRQYYGDDPEDQDEVSHAAPCRVSDSDKLPEKSRWIRITS